MRPGQEVRPPNSARRCPLGPPSDSTLPSPAAYGRSFSPVGTGVTDRGTEMQIRPMGVRDVGTRMTRDSVLVHVLRRSTVVRSSLYKPPGRLPPIPNARPVFWPPRITLTPFMHAIYSLMAHHSADDSDYFMDDDAHSVASSASMRYAPSTSTSATSHDWEMRSASPAPSMYSVTSSLRAASYRHEYGRGINNYSEVYRLPADDEEFERLGLSFSTSLLPLNPHPLPSDHQHIMFMEVMGKYAPPLPEILAEDPSGEPKAVVDLGCGSGSWSVEPVCNVSSPCLTPSCVSRILDVARDFPHCSAVAVDLVPMQDV